MTLPSPRAVVPARAQCSVCRRPADGGSLRCENCQGRAHRRCLGLAAGAYPGGWFWCCHCLLAEAGLQPGQGGPYVAGLADQVVNLAGSAVGGSSAVTYEAHRRRYLEFVTESLGASAETAFPTERGKDLNRVVVCLFIVHASSRWSRSTIEGTLSALADWQRSRGVPASGYIRQDPMVQRTLAQALRARVGVMAAGPKAKAGMPVSMLRILIDWLAAKVQVAPGDSAEREQDACWLVLGFFGMLRRSELAGLQVGDVRELPGGGLAVAIRRSKTDQLGVGAVVHLADVSGSGVRIGQLVARHVGNAVADGAAPKHPLFCKGARWGPRPVGLAKGGFTGRLRALLREVQRGYPQLGFDVAQFSAHSLRRGGATAATTGGAQREAIKAHGRWKSDAVGGYVVPAASVRMQIVEKM